MSHVDFRAWLTATPFVPFRVVTRDGTSYDVKRPEMCMVGIPSVLIGQLAPELPYAYARWDVVSMVHVVRLEATAGNGEAK